MPCHRALSVLLFTLGASALAPAQIPVDGPPWWAKNDDVTVSLYWSFDNAATFRQPSFQVVPAWYQASVTQLLPGAPLQQFAQLGGNTGVLGFTGTGQPLAASLALVVDNDPHLDWIKIFFVQFDALEGASGDVEAAIDQALADYERSGYTAKSTPLGNGWERVTIEAQLYPQPDDEAMTWTFVEAAFGAVGIDNLFVSSKCIKYGGDDDALGAATGVLFDATAATGGQTVVAAAVTQAAAPGLARTYWLSTLGTQATTPLQLVRVDEAGQALGATPLPNTAQQVPNGASDLAVEDVVVGNVIQQQFVYALLDRRATATGNVAILAFDAAGVAVPARNVLLAGFPAIPAQDFGLAFDPTGDTGAGTFWVTDNAGNAYEFARSGALLTTHGNLPPGVTGAGYDYDHGNFYLLSRAPRATPLGALRVNGSEWSGYTHAPTGVEFCGDLNLPNPNGPRGGIAGGLEVYRRRVTREFRMVCTTQLQNPSRSVVYELHGPFRFGRSIAGRCRMSGGPWFGGSPTCTIGLETRPTATFATLYAGFSKTTFAGQPLPRPLAPFGFVESHLSISLDLSSVLLLPNPGGGFRFTLPSLPAGVFSYVPFHFQWLVFDPTLPGGLGLSQPAQMVAY